MARFLIALILFITACSAKPSTDAGANTAPQDSITQLSDTYLTALSSLNQFNGVVLLKKDGEIVLKKAYTITKDPDYTLYVTENSQFDLRSVAKLFAKVSLADLEEAGKISAEQPIHHYLPGFPNPHNITVQHLMDNASGLPREFTTDKKLADLQPDEVLELAKQETLEFEPGTKQQYSNVGFQLLYYLIGTLHQSSFLQYLRDSYFTPLGMVHSGSNFDDSTGRKTDYAHGHYLTDSDALRCECDVPDDDMRMGNLYSTADDLEAFLDYLDRERMLTLITSSRLTTYWTRTQIPSRFLMSIILIGPRQD